MVEKNKVGALVEISDAKNIEYHEGNFIYGRIVYSNSSTPDFCVRIKAEVVRDGYVIPSNCEELNIPKTHAWYYGQKNDINYDIW